MMMHDKKNISRGHNIVSSTAISERNMESDIQNSSHLLRNSKWLNVTTIQDQTLAHGFTMDKYQFHGPSSKENTYVVVVAITLPMLPLEHVVQKMWEFSPLKDTSNSCVNLITMLPTMIETISAN